MAQLDPFHCSMTSARLFPLTSVAYPTAKQIEADAQLTLVRIAPVTPGPLGLGLGTIDQPAPLQCSMRVPVGFEEPEASIAPTDQQSDPLTQVAPNNPPPSPDGNGSASSVHVEPFHDSMRGLTVDGEPPERFDNEMPTAQHWKALAQVEPRGTSSTPVPGTVAMYHPEVAAVAAGDDRKALASKATAATQTTTAAPWRTGRARDACEGFRSIRHACSRPALRR